LTEGFDRVRPSGQARLTVCNYIYNVPSPAGAVLPAMKGTREPRPGLLSLEPLSRAHTARSPVADQLLKLLRAADGDAS